MITGLNHVTFGVSNLDKAIFFYCEILGGTLRVKWDVGAYITFGELWLALNVAHDNQLQAMTGCSHLAFSVSNDMFQLLRSKLKAYNIEPYKVNSSEGDSYYFRDPDGNNLEIHVGDLESRIASIRKSNNGKYTIFD